MLKLIVCVDKNYGISKNGKLAWNIKEEMEHFKSTTLNSTIVMGRKTYESIGKLLPNRNNIILSSNKKLKIQGAKIYSEIKPIIDLSKKEDIFVIGGKQIYNIFIDYVDEIIISTLNKEYDCDLFWKPNLKTFSLLKKDKRKEFTIYYYKSNKDKIINGKLISKKISEELLHKKNNLVKKYTDTPKLAIIQVGNDFGSSVYVRNKVNLGKELGIDVDLKKYDKISEDDLISEIIKLNKNKRVNGILVQHPLPKNIDEEKVSNSIDPLKDADCFHPFNLGLVFRGVSKSEINSIPCTPWGVIEMLKHSNVDLNGKDVVIVGRSNIVGKPLIPLFINENSTVTVCHSRTKNIKNILKKADIIVMAIGKANYLKSSDIKDGAILIDVGINRDQNNVICGDVDFNSCLKKASLISPVPNGVGPMTLTMLFANLLNLYEKQKKLNKK